MAFTDPTDTIQAKLTDGGRGGLASLTLGSVGFHLNSFQVGRGGYIPANPVKRIAVDTTATDLADPVGSRFPFELIDTAVTASTVVPVCRLGIDETDMNHGLGELGIFAEWTTHDANPALVGTEFLFALAHFPIISKTPGHVLVWRVAIAL